MSIPRWTFPTEASAAETKILKRVRKKRKLFAFLREHRHRLFDTGFQEELEQMYRDTGAGKSPVPPARMAMAILLQGYMGSSDSDAVECAASDNRWQMVLDSLGEEPPFSQGALVAFRERMIKYDMDVRLLQRTRELAKETGAFDWKKLPNDVRVAIDSSPLLGAGRVEDSINLLAHAARAVALSMAVRQDKPVELVVDELGIPLLAESSVKAALDVDWNVEAERVRGLNMLLEQIETLETRIQTLLGPEAKEPPFRQQLQLLRDLRDQNLEPDPAGGGARVRTGVAKDRRISVTDPDMRHGRKTKTKAFNGYKRHVAADLDTKLILAVALAPANRPENEALDPVLNDLRAQRISVSEIYFDRGYVSNEKVMQMSRDGIGIVCRPWAQRNRGLFPKSVFRFDFRKNTVTCPAGETQRFRLGETIEFDGDACTTCARRAQCTTRKAGRGRCVRVAEDEPLQVKLRKLARTRSGRAKLRERVIIEHRLAHVGQRQGRRARYRGLRKNLFDLRRIAAIENLNVIHHDQQAHHIRIAA